MRFNDKELGAWASVFSADKEGLLEKKGAGRGQGYRQRWFRLKGNLLFYFKVDELGGWEEQSHSENLESLKQSERECFDALGDTILASHEKERAQSEKMKYYFRLGSVVGAIVGFAGSNFFLRREVRTHQRLQVEKIESVEQTLRQLVLQCDPSSATTTTEDSTVELRTLILEEGEKQTTLLGDIRNRMALCNTEDTVDNSTLVLGTGAAIFALSFAIFAAIAALNGSR